jgi:hypothetical protein
LIAKREVWSAQVKADHVLQLLQDTDQDSIGDACGQSLFEQCG